MLPILERLLYKPKQAPVTRVLVVTPTRELAVQIHQVSRQLAQFTKVDISLSAGRGNNILVDIEIYIGITFNIQVKLNTSVPLQVIEFLQ